MSNEPIHCELSDASPTVSPEVGGPPEWPTAVDCMDEAGSHDAEDSDTEEPAGIGDPSYLFDPFPVDVLPEPVRQYVIESAGSIGCDPSFIALPTLAALAGTIGNTRVISISPDWLEPSILWAGIVGDSGTKKTPALNAATRFLTEIQNEALAQDAKERELFKDQSLRHEAEIANWKKKMDGSNPPQKPVEPVAQRYIVNDTTIEALADRLGHAPRGLLLVSDELAGWFNGFDQYKGGRGSDAQHWLTLYNAQALLMDRKSTGLIHVPRASVSVVGGVQPATLRRILGEKYYENGMAARLLFVSPSRRRRVWSKSFIDPDLIAKMAGVFRLLSLLDFRRNDGPPFQPVALSLTEKAKDRFIEFYNRHAREQEGLTEKEAALWSKLEATAARLALVINLVREAASDPTLGSTQFVDETSMDAGITLADWFGTEGRRIYRMLDECGEASNVRQLMELIEREGGTMTVRELMRSGHRYPDADSATSALDALVKAGRARWVEEEAGEKGGRPTRHVLLVRESADKPTKPR